MCKPRLKKKYITKVISEMKNKFGYKNDMAVPKITKVVINAGMGNIIKDSKEDFEKAKEDFASIAGQRPVITKAKKAISNFKTKKGMSVGLMAVLRNVKMYEFLDRFINVVLPQVRDFRGLGKKSFDGNGNYSIGIKEHIVFPEVKKDDIRRIFGLEINITTNAKTNEEAYELLKSLGFPITDDIS